MLACLNKNEKYKNAHLIAENAENYSYPISLYLIEL